MSVQSLYQNIVKWDMSIIKRYCVEKDIYTAGEIDTVESEYKKWLALAFDNLKKGLSIPVSEKIDDMWHTHILFTEDYTALCMTHYGGYMHHRPAILDDERELDMSFVQHTLDSYRRHFGSPNPVFWSKVLCRCGPTDAPLRTVHAAMFGLTDKPPAGVQDYF